ncbi:YfbM family protein [Streptomyces sp. NPDC088194]|uniref:YfbM family protein n=1 Tax=Streptomyces sp. NPDC088194 TaxID=3154931 RepID=UPI00344BFCBB
MNGEYLRVTPAELARAVTDPDWAFEYAMEIMETDGSSAVAPSDARQLTTHKAFAAIAFLLQRASFPVDIVHGEQALTSEDWGYGPARYLDADRVKLAAGALADLSFEDLSRDVDPEQMTAAQIYPLLWDEPGALEWVRGWFDPLAPFFGAAAQAGEAMLVWLD